MVESSKVSCPACRAENPAGQKFCGECGARLPLVCSACQAPNPSANKFCGECGAKLAGSAPASSSAPPAVAPPASIAASAPPAALSERFASPESYTPKHLAEKILTSRSAIEGERKLVTVMFTDVSGFTAMSERLDPEEVHGIMDRAFEVILGAVHRIRGHHQPVPRRWRHGALRRADRPRGPWWPRAAGRARHPAETRAPPGGRPARPRARVPHADRDQQRARRGRRHWPRPPDGLHRGGRYRESRGAAHGDLAARAGGGQLRTRGRCARATSSSKTSGSSS